MTLAQVTLAVLAGGEGRRMGMPKSRLRIGQRPILQVILEQLQWPGPTMLVTSPLQKNPPAAEWFGQEVVDPVAEGPLRGIRTALEHCSTEMLAVIPVDMLFVGKEALEWLINELHSRPQIIGVMGKRKVKEEWMMEPFPMICRRAALGEMESYWSEGNRSMRGLAEKPTFAAIECPGDWASDIWFNFNTPAEYAQFLIRYNQTR